MQITSAVAALKWWTVGSQLAAILLTLLPLIRKLRLQSPVGLDWRLKGLLPDLRPKHPRSTYSASEKDAKRRQRALEKQFAKAQKMAEAPNDPGIPGSFREVGISLGGELAPQPLQEDQL